MKKRRYLAYPLGFLYALAVFVRNKLYDWKILNAQEFDIPVISVGNLSVGGTGKTPQTEYLVRLLKQQFSIAVLSRGYGRRTKGFLLADGYSSAAVIGDEPRQYKLKFPDVPIAVAESRAAGIRMLRQKFPALDAILLDDAFQHRSVKAKLSILLTEYSNPFYKDCILPYGNLREFRSGMKRADVVIVSKVPENLSPAEKNKITDELHATPQQRVFFSLVQYGKLLPFRRDSSFTEMILEEAAEKGYSIVLVTGIADPRLIEERLRSKISKVYPFHFDDHHEYSPADLRKVTAAFDSLKEERKIILTTEKDFMRLDNSRLKSITDKYPFYYLPVETLMLEKEDFEKLIIPYVGRNKSYGRVPESQYRGRA